MFCFYSLRYMLCYLTREICFVLLRNHIIIIITIIIIIILVITFMQGIYNYRHKTIFRFTIPVVFTYIKRRKYGPSKHNCLVVLFIATIATTCFGRAWPASTPDRILHIRSPQKPSTLEPHPHRSSPTQTAAANQPDIQSCFFSFVHDINIVT
jgi:hypothetical protein